MKHSFNILAIIIIALTSLVKSGIDICEKEDGSLVYGITGLSSVECCDHDEESKLSLSEEHLEAADCDDSIVQLMNIDFCIKEKSFNPIDMKLVYTLTSYEPISNAYNDRKISVSLKPPPLKVLINNYLLTRQSVILIV